MAKKQQKQSILSVVITTLTGGKGKKKSHHIRDIKNMTGGTINIAGGDIHTTEIRISKRSSKTSVKRDR